jgi:predicted dehydrogenase
VANLMQRYNPIYEQVQRLIQSKVLGEVLHGFFENYANDEALGPDHWFWDQSKSGGIFVEHGVHFFDMFSGWLGSGKIVAAQRTTRPGTGVEEQVQCSVRYANGSLVNFYHGFTQPARMDRQEFRLLFERGDVTLQEWVPVRVKIHAVVDEKSTRELLDLFPGGRLEVINAYGGKGRAATARFKPLDIYQQIEITYDPNLGKLRCYCDCIRDMMRDQVRWIYNRDHVRKLTEQNGRESLSMAVEATRLAHQME